jgi:hypothetical protein
MTFANALIARNDFPANSLADIASLAKDKPGQINYAMQGVGSAGNLSGELWRMLTGIRINAVGYKGAGEIDKSDWRRRAACVHEHDSSAQYGQRSHQADRCDERQTRSGVAECADIRGAGRAELRRDILVRAAHAGKGAGAHNRAPQS